MSLQNWFNDASVRDAQLWDSASRGWNQESPLPGIGHNVQAIGAGDQHEDPRTNVTLKSEMKDGLILISEHKFYIISDLISLFTDSFQIFNALYIIIQEVGSIIIDKYPHYLDSSNPDNKLRCSTAGSGKDMKFFNKDSFFHNKISSRLILHHSSSNVTWGQHGSFRSKICG